MNQYQQIDKDWDSCMLRVGRRITESFEMNNIGFTDALVGTNCTRLILPWIYHHLIYKHGLVRIEDLDQDTKEKNWQFVKEISAGRVKTVQKMKEVAIAFYVIEYFINEQK
jgi:hypothetical protein